jgi:transposase
MSDRVEELARRLVIGHKRDGRSVYDEQAKAELVAECAKPGASVSRVARQAGVNANQLSRWIRERGQGGRRRATSRAVVAAPEAFVPVAIETSIPAAARPTLSFQARMPNGVVIDLAGCDLTQAGQLIQAFGRLRCSGSTTL